MNNTKKLSGWMILYLLMALNPINVKAEDSQRIVITSPADGTTVSTGSTINIVVEAQPSHAISELSITKPLPSPFTKFLFGELPKIIYNSPTLVPTNSKQSDYIIVSNPPYNFSLKINKKASVGEHFIQVGGVINGVFTESQPIKIIVESPVDPPLFGRRIQGSTSEISR